VGALFIRALSKDYPKGRINSRIFPVRIAGGKSIAGNSRNMLETAEQFWYKLPMQ
jgi:hypothetical protein